MSLLSYSTIRTVASYSTVVTGHGFNFLFDSITSGADVAANRRTAISGGNPLAHTRIPTNGAAYYEE